MYNADNITKDQGNLPLRSLILFKIKSNVDLSIYNKV